MTRRKNTPRKRSHASRLSVSYQECWKRYRNVKASFSRRGLSENLELGRILAAAPHEKRLELREFLVEGLAFIAAFDDFGTSRFYAEEMHRRANQLRSLARQMEAAARNAKHILDLETTDRVKDYFASPEAYAWQNEKLPGVIEVLEQAADRIRLHASAFGVYNRHSIPRGKWTGVRVLAERVRNDTGHNFHDELATLLSEAYDVVGITRIFSDGQIRKQLARTHHADSQPLLNLGQLD